MLSFGTWLEQQEMNEASRERANVEDLAQAEHVLERIEVGDIIDLGKETQFKGQQTPKYGKVVEVGKDKIIVQPFVGGKIAIIKPGDLYYVDPNDNIPEAQQRIVKDLSKIGAKHLWVKRTQRQRAIEIREKARADADREAANQAFLSMLKLDKTPRDYTRPPPKELPRVAPAATTSPSDKIGSLLGTQRDSGPLVTWKSKKDSAATMLGEPEVEKEDPMTKFNAMFGEKPPQRTPKPNLPFSNKRQAAKSAFDALFAR